MASKPWLRDYFKRLARHIEKNEILNERALSATVELPLEGWTKAKTLLQALCYEKDSVQAQYWIQIGTSRPKVDFVLGRELNRWMLELKKPGEACDHPKHIRQLQSYLGQERMPFGVIFNGKWVMAYVNPDHEFINDLWKTVTENELEQVPLLDLRINPVLKITMSSDNTREMVHFFQSLRNEVGVLDIKDFASKLAGSYLKRIRNENKATTRVSSITDSLRAILQNPDESFIQAMIDYSPDLSQIRVTSKEIIEVWPAVTKGL